MRFEFPLCEGTLLKRYKRFLADVSLPDGNQITIHCPNTGSMRGCDVLGSRIWFSKVDKPNRKYPYTWELIEVDGGHLVGVNTHRPNALVQEAIEIGVVETLSGYSSIKREQTFEDSRLDLMLTSGDETCYVEVKNVTLMEEDGMGYFPDAVTTRGTKHLHTLMKICEQGHRGVLFFCVQHTGINEVRPADSIDPVYGQTLRQAMAKGVEVLAFGADMSPLKIELRHPLPVVVS